MNFFASCFEYHVIRQRFLLCKLCVIILQAEKKMLESGDNKEVVYLCRRQVATSELHFRFSSVFSRHLYLPRLRLYFHLEGWNLIIEIGFYWYPVSPH